MHANRSLTNLRTQVSILTRRSRRQSRLAIFRRGGVRFGGRAGVVGEGVADFLVLDVPNRYLEVANYEKPKVYAGPESWMSDMISVDLIAGGFGEVIECHRGTG
jgi:hypothetical protein